MLGECLLLVQYPVLMLGECLLLVQYPVLMLVQVLSAVVTAGLRYCVLVCLVRAG